MLVRPARAETVIKAIMAAYPEGDVTAVTAQDVLLGLSLIIRAEPGLLKGVRILRLVEITQLLAEEHPFGAEGLANDPPSALLASCEALLAQTPAVRTILDDRFSLTDEARPGTDWARWRARLGVLIRVRTDFYARVWGLLGACDRLIIGAPDDPDSALDAALARADRTAQERDFGLGIEAQLARIESPAYRAFCLEALNVLALAHEADPQKKLKADLALDPLIHGAVAHLWAHAAPLAKDAWASAVRQPPDVFARALAAVLFAPAAREAAPAQ
jgi:phosphorylase kinase alpha/beta subunit